MAITFVSNGTIQQTTLDSDSAPYPTGWAADDFLLLAVEDGGATLTADAGWTAVPGSNVIGSGVGLALWYRIAQAGDSGSVGYGGTSINQMQGTVLGYRGVDTTTPLDVTPVTGTAAASTSVTLPSVTTVNANAMVILAIARADDRASGNNFLSWTNANLTSLTERVDTNYAGGNDGSLGIADGIKATAGATGTTALSVSVSAASAYLTLALRPATGGPPPPTTYDSCGVLVAF
jgi:hypothetical protein